MTNSQHYSTGARACMFAYGMVCYLVFIGTLVHVAAFVGGFGLTNTLDGSVVDPMAGGVDLRALLIDIGLIGLFTLQHSVMARPGFKLWFIRHVPQPIERSTFVLAASLTLNAVCVFWEPIGGDIWMLDTVAGKAVMYLGYLTGWILVLATTFSIDHFDLFGVRQVWFAACQRRYEPPVFKTPWLYSVVRHPLYMGWLFVFWCTPFMTAAHLFFAVLLTVYVFVGIHFEEADLAAKHIAYKRYKTKVPMILPGKMATVKQWKNPTAKNSG
ncbi:MAG: isoprenylcysteine carboxylmethyltransferase family protein [Pseudomonadales bacterium]|nr:isoprenylcysteine carboxylmethyltransferase family protein [Pseudomonadales bacterium]